MCFETEKVATKKKKKTKKKRKTTTTTTTVNWLSAIELVKLIKHQKGRNKPKTKTSKNELGKEERQN